MIFLRESVQTYNPVLSKIEESLPNSQVMFVKVRYDNLQPLFLVVRLRLAVEVRDGLEDVFLHPLHLAYCPYICNIVRIRVCNVISCIHELEVGMEVRLPH